MRQTEFSVRMEVARGSPMPNSGPVSMSRHSLGVLSRPAAQQSALLINRLTEAEPLIPRALARRLELQRPGRRLVAAKVTLP